MDALRQMPRWALVVVALSAVLLLPVVLLAAALVGDWIVISALRVFDLLFG